ncbi:uncharacterized protein LOC111875925 [Lactuca sativa]|uniref:Uncharacterized protein n=1 Tax=Lactuca sativa TaxID=4236 RepID=A0A9R1W8I2_LACSA|nr:uncharacterized protein LOC111875925 [Lactuca sativa]KAJ0220415.1 hypothetical protein LSAT_V11C200060520 [Lactuca sativa]
MPDTVESSQKSLFHPAFGDNIKKSIPLFLDHIDDQHTSWKELFNIHVYAYNVMDHIKPKYPRPDDIDETTWLHLDVIPGATAQELWDQLEENFQDNKATRSIYTEEEFNSTHLESFSNIYDYSSRLKSISDQLENIGNPVSETKMVLQLISSLSKSEYDTVATLIQQTEPLPSFNKATSQLILEETWHKNQSSRIPHAFITQKSTESSSDAKPPTSDSNLVGPNTTTRGGRCTYRRRGGHDNNRGSGRCRGRFNNSGPFSYQWPYKW